MSSTSEEREEARWLRAAELPYEVFAALRKPNRAIAPVAIVATVDEDGSLRTAPFGSLRVNVYHDELHFNQVREMVGSIRG